jgi:hypothetical protein
MKPTLVVNSRINIYDVYIGRGSKWGNPYATQPGIGVRYIVGSRREAVEMFENWIHTQSHLMAALHELRGKRLGCPGCNPDRQACHGHILAELADSLPTNDLDGTLTKPTT